MADVGPGSVASAGPSERETLIAMALQVKGLAVDRLHCPLGLENLQPLLSWHSESGRRNTRQLAYRILVSEDEASLRGGSGTLWDSGKVVSAQSVGVRYEGRPLVSRQRCWWCVQVWDDQDQPSLPSAASWWEMGFLQPSDWSAEWLAAEDGAARTDRETGLQWVWGVERQSKAPRYFRYRFELPHAGQSGRLFVTAEKIFFQQVSGLWLDGAPLVVPPGELLAGQWLELGPLSAGQHLIAIEVTPADVALAFSKVQHVDGVTLFARIELENGERVRIGQEASFRTSLEHAADWYRPSYDDEGWQLAPPALIDDFQPWPAAPAMKLRRTFALERQVVKARLYITALGAYEARLNGKRVGDALLTPEISQYAKRVLYRAYDVTPMLQLGGNVLGLTVGDGWYASWDGAYFWGGAPRRVLGQLELVFSDGSQRVVATGPGWRTAQAAIRKSEVRLGELYDGRFEQPGWDGIGFNDSDWEEAQIADAMGCRLVAQVSPPIRATQLLRPCAISQPRAGVYVVDFGQCFAGWCRLQVRGEAGTRIELRFAEVVRASGEIDQVSMGVDSLFKEPKRDVFILRGGAEEILEPHFTYRGFRYVEVTGLEAAPTMDSIAGIVVHTDLETTGHFRSDSPLLNRLWNNILWTQRSNFVAIPTDNPHREQRGWMGDAGAFWDTAAFNMDVAAFTTRQMDNVVDDQEATGAFPQLAPSPQRMHVFCSNGTPPAWADGGIILPWTVWQRYGDLSVAERHWDAMNRYLRFIQDSNADHIWRNQRGLDWGDWLSPDLVSFDANTQAPLTPKDLIGTAYWAHSVDLMAQMAGALDRTAQCESLRALSGRIRQAFNREFVRQDGTVGNGTQTSHVLALRFGLLDEPIAGAAAERLAQDIRQRGVALSTGLIGTQYILDVLTDFGYADLAYGLLLREEHPSWGHMIRNGATTIWETWSGEFSYETGKPKKVAQNQYALGSIGGFLFRRVAGIVAAAPGFASIKICPVIDPRVHNAGAHYDSVMGRISTHWSLASNGGLTLEVAIPANTTAMIHLPARRTDRIEEAGEEIASRNDMRLVSRLEREARVEVGSGTFRFVVVT